MIMGLSISVKITGRAEDQSSSNDHKVLWFEGFHIISGTGTESLV